MFLYVSVAFRVWRGKVKDVCGCEKEASAVLLERQRVLRAAGERVDMKEAFMSGVCECIPVSGFIIIS